MEGNNSVRILDNVYVVFFFRTEFGSVIFKAKKLFQIV